MNKTMKNAANCVVYALLGVLLLSCLTGCGKKVDSALWEKALYTEDTELGEGSKTVKVVVEADTHKITFTIHTDEEVLGDALLANKLIEGDESEFGLYVKKVNGITADYDVDQSYWAFYQNGEYMNTGVDGAAFEDGAQYELVYTKG